MGLPDINIGDRVRVIKHVNATGETTADTRYVGFTGTVLDFTADRVIVEPDHGTGSPDDWGYFYPEELKVTAKQDVLNMKSAANLWSEIVGDWGTPPTADKVTKFAKAVQERWGK